MSIAVVFPGQGSQFVGMGKDFYESHEGSKALFERADKALGYKLSKIMFEGPEDELRLTMNTQPALLTMSAVIWDAVKSKIKPVYFAGHSLGEYSAIYAAEGLSFEDGVKAVHNRGKFMQDAVPVGVGAMAAVLGMADDTVIQLCKEFSKPGAVCEPANFNCDGQIVVAGHAGAVTEFAELLKEKGAKRVIMLPVSAPFHCSLMAPAGQNMTEYLAGVKLHDLKTPIFNNIDAKKVSANTDILDGLLRQVTGSVRWTESVRNMISGGVDTFIEVGSGAVLSGLIKKIDKGVTTINISSVSDLSKI